MGVEASEATYLDVDDVISNLQHDGTVKLQVAEPPTLREKETMLPLNGLAIDRAWKRLPLRTPVSSLNRHERRPCREFYCRASGAMSTPQGTQQKTKRVLR